LNCVEDLSGIAANLSDLVRTRGMAVICMSTRICPWEIAWHGVRGNLSKAFRRARGKSVARLDGVSVPVWYPTLRELRRTFAPWFRIGSVRAVGLIVPPSYVEEFAREHRKLLRGAERLDRIFATWPVLRGLGDHVLLEMQRTLIESKAQAQ